MLAAAKISFRVIVTPWHTALNGTPPLTWKRPA